MGWIVAGTAAAGGVVGVGALAVAGVSYAFFRNASTPPTERYVAQGVSIAGLLVGGGGLIAATVGGVVGTLSLLGE
jgi:hypothetical protein